MSDDDFKSQEPRPLTARAIPPAPPAPRAQGRGWVVAFLGLFLMLSLCCNVTLIGGQANNSRRVSSGKSLHEATFRKGTLEGRVLMIRVEGVIMRGSSGGLFGGASEDIVKVVKDRLDYARMDESVGAVVLRVDSPGGGVTESDEIYDAITRFQSETKKPIVVSMGGICASGGVYISAPGDVIFAQPTTITGSIGVIMGGTNYSGFMEKYGFQDVSITSGPNKDLLNASKPIREEHRKILQALVDDMYQRFVGIVSKGRKISPEEIQARELADGRVFSATEAQKLGLVDQVGYLDAAVDEAVKRAGAKGGEVFELSGQPNLLDVLQGRASIDMPKIEVPPLLDSSPRMFYLWRP